MSYPDIGSAAVGRFSCHRCIYYRQPDGRITFGTAALDLARSSLDPARYGLQSWNVVKGNLVGEAMNADVVLDVIRHPSNPFNLIGNARYELTRQDRDDLKLIALGSRPLYDHVRAIAEELGIASPAPDPEPKPRPRPEPIPVPTPSPDPVPTPTNTQIASTLRDLASQLVTLANRVENG